MTDENGSGGPPVVPTDVVATPRMAAGQAGVCRPGVVPTEKSTGGGWPLALLLAACLLLPRVLFPARFLTPDEVLFLNHARQFLAGLATGDHSLTLGIGYPGVTVAWAGAAGLSVLYLLSRSGLGPLATPGLTLEQFLAAADVRPLPYYVAGRLATGLLTAFLLFVLYRLMHRWWGQRRAQPIAVAATLLLALDPFILGYSRLFHIEVLLALLMLAAMLAWGLWLRDRGPGWLGATGVLVGLAFLTKSTALVLLPTLAGLALLDWLLAQPRPAPAWLLRVAAGWLAVLALTVLVTVILWPAMWQVPDQAMSLTLGKLWLDKDAGEGNLGMYWMGRFVEDPGPAFYPVALLLKISPLLVLGLVAGLWPRRGGKVLDPAERSRRRWLWAYALAYVLFMTVMTKKSVRYLLPGYVDMAPLAAVGWARLWEWARARWEILSRGAVAVVAMVALSLAVALPYAPQFFSFYNPLVLGWRWAPHAMLVGWGEGLGDAARYLNEQPGAETARVTAWYDWTFAPFFKGQTVPFSTQEAMTADYSVLYVNQVQRDIPDPNLISYFGRRQPLHVVRQNGIDYAWIYAPLAADRPLPADATEVEVRMGGAVTLEGYAVPPAQEGAGLWVTLYWRCREDDLPDHFVYVRAVTADGQIVARADAPPAMGFYPTSRWKKGQLVEDIQGLVRPPETPAGAYRLEVGMYDPNTWAVLEPATGERGAGGGVILTEVWLP